MRQYRLGQYEGGFGGKTVKMVLLVDKASSLKHPFSLLLCCKRHPECGCVCLGPEVYEQWRRKTGLDLVLTRLECFVKKQQFIRFHCYTGLVSSLREVTLIAVFTISKRFLKFYEAQLAGLV